MKKVIISLAMSFIAFTAMSQSYRANTDTVLMSMLHSKDTVWVNAKVDSLLASSVEGNHFTVFAYYSYKKNESKSTAIKEAAIKRWPKGMFVIHERTVAISKENDFEKKASLYEKAIKEFGPEKFDDVTYDLATLAAKEGDKKKMMHYASKLKANRSVYTIGSLATYLAAKDPKGAIPLLKSELDNIKGAIDSLRNVQPFDKAVQTKVDGRMFTYDYFGAAYCKALVATKGPEQAWPTILSIYDFTGKGKRTEEIYLDAALQTKRYTVALPLMEKAIAQGEASPEIKSKLKEVYVAVKGSENGFQEFEDGIAKKSNDAILAHVATLAINKPSKDFTLNDVNGKQVTLSSMKGKIVVLDFWATWCGPCKASFPSMQMAKNKYKNDPNVQFLFIHTFDNSNGNPTAEAAKYITDNKYDFEVLMDLRSEETRTSPVANSYGIDGIPTKLIIDAKGNLRFQVTGFGSGNDKAVAELSAMIEYVRNNS